MKSITQRKQQEYIFFSSSPYLVSVCHREEIPNRPAADKADFFKCKCWNAFVFRVDFCGNQLDLWILWTCHLRWIPGGRETRSLWVFDHEHELILVWLNFIQVHFHLLKCGVKSLTRVETSLRHSCSKSTKISLCLHILNRWQRYFFHRNTDRKKGLGNNREESL